MESCPFAGQHLTHPVTHENQVSQHPGFKSEVGGLKSEVGIFGAARMNRKSSTFKNIKLGKNVYRQLKRRGPQSPPPGKQPQNRVPAKPRP